MAEIFAGRLAYNELISWILISLVPWFLTFLYPLLPAVWFFYCVRFVWRQFYKIQWVEATGKVVYITGCDSGFGKAAALALANSGFTVCAGCYRPDQCDQEVKSHPNIRILDLDVTDDEKVHQCAEIVARECDGKGLWALCNNAGYATAGEIEWLTLDVYKKQMETNLWGAVRVTKSVLPLIREARGRIVTVTTGISRFANAGRSPYCMSKASLEAFTDCLRYEMKKFGVKCSTIQPGNLTSSTNVFDGVSVQLRRCFEQLKPAVRAAYGDEYLDKFYNQVCGKYVASGGDSIQPVIDTYLHAIASAHPRIRYRPMQMYWMVWLFFYYLLPEELTDGYLTVTGSLASTIKK